MLDTIEEPMALGFQNTPYYKQSDNFRTIKTENLERLHKNFVENEKNQSCSKVPEMTRKLVENKFWTF